MGTLSDYFGCSVFDNQITLGGLLCGSPMRYLLEEITMEKKSYAEIMGRLEAHL